MEDLSENENTVAVLTIYYKEKIDFCTELHGVRIYRDTSHYRASTVFSTFGRIEIKQDGKGASFGFCILFHIDSYLE